MTVTRALTAAGLGWLALAAPALGQVPIGTTPDTRPAAPQHRPSWKEGGLAVGFNGLYLQGNVDMLTANGSLNANMNQGPHQLFLDAGNTFTRASGNVIVNRIAGSLLYAYAYAEDANVYGYVTNASDASVQLDYRVTAGLGGCRHKLFAPFFSLFLVSLNPAYEQEYFKDGTSAQAWRAVARLNAIKPLMEGVELGGDAFVTPAVPDMADVRVYAETYAKFKLVDALSLKLTAADAYDTRPRPGVQANDVGVFATLMAEWSR